jgi:hypothetical protein
MPRPAHRPKKSVSNESDAADSYSGRPHSGTLAVGESPSPAFGPDGTRRTQGVVKIYVT